MLDLILWLQQHQQQLLQDDRLQLFKQIISICLKILTDEMFHKISQPTNIHSKTLINLKYLIARSQQCWVLSAHISPLTSCQLAVETMASHTQGVPGRYQAGSVPSYWTVQSILRMYQSLIKSNPIITKSITNGIIALIGSSISQVCKTWKTCLYFLDSGSQW